MSDTSSLFPSWLLLSAARASPLPPPAFEKFPGYSLSSRGPWPVITLSVRTAKLRLRYAEGICEFEDFFCNKARLRVIVP